MGKNSSIILFHFLLYILYNMYFTGKREQEFILHAKRMLVSFGEKKKTYLKLPSKFLETESHGTLHISPKGRLYRSVTSITLGNNPGALIQLHLPKLLWRVENNSRNLWDYQVLQSDPCFYWSVSCRFTNHLYYCKFFE